MTYIQLFGEELTQKLNASEKTETIVQWVLGKILESYKNGLAAGRKRATVNHQDKNRSNGSPSQK